MVNEKSLTNQGYLEHKLAAIVEIQQATIKVKEIINKVISVAQVAVIDILQQYYDLILMDSDKTKTELKIKM